MAVICLSAKKTAKNNDFIFAGFNHNATGFEMLIGLPFVRKKAQGLLILSFPKPKHRLKNFYLFFQKLKCIPFN